MNKDFIKYLNRSLSQVVDVSSLSADHDGLIKEKAHCKKNRGPFFVPQYVITKKGHHFRGPLFSVPKLSDLKKSYG